MITLSTYWGWLALTVLIEVGLAAFSWPGLGDRLRRMAVIGAVNLLTHPIATVAVMEGVPWGPAELAVVGAEGALLAWGLGCSPGRALAASCTLNGVTAALGAALS